VSAIAQATDVPLAKSWNWPVRNLLRDLRVRRGIKLGLAGLLALCLTQLLPLPHDSWAILTVLVMMLSQYVGAAAVKAIMRVAGTIAGAMVGVWLVGNYTSTPIVFLPVLFVVMAYATYQFGHLGLRQLPYSFFLLGLTTLVIATDGIAFPDQVWQLGLYRTEEILAGVISALLVSTLLWPRYARDEFLTSARKALLGVEALVPARIEIPARGAVTNAALDDLRQAFAARFSSLINLRQAGARESSLFSAQLPHYDAYLVSLGSVCDLALYLAARRLTDSPIVDRLRNELEQVYRGFAEEIRILSAPRRPGELLPASSLNAAFADLERKLTEVWGQGFLMDQSIAADVTFGSHFAALELLRDELNTLRDITNSLPRRGQPQPKPISSLVGQPTIDWFWVRIAIKGGLAAVIGVTLLKWIHPPGAAAIPLMAWLCASSGRVFLRAGGSGDCHGLQNAFLGCLVFAGCTVVLLVITPLLANYLAMNLALFFVLFGFGFATARIVGISFGMQLGLLSISAFVGLNPQQPVSSQTIIDTFVGLGIGLFIGAAVGRFLWPVLPQTVLREDLLGILADLKGLLSGDSQREVVQIRLALRSVETYQAARQIRLPGRWRSKEERELLYTLTMELVVLAYRVKHFTALRDDLPQAAEPFLRLPLQRLRIEFIQLLGAFTDCLRIGSTQRDLPTVDGALTEMDEGLRQIRDQRILASYPAKVPLLTLNIVGRYHAVASALNKVRSLIAEPQIRSCWGDYAL
jgi:p-hydroxybenzoic acid efflux pump subunit AaeB